MAHLLRAGLVLCALFACTAQRPTNEEWKAGQKEKADEKAGAAADQAKMAAVDKVVSMLEDLQLQVLAEGEAEAATYNKFACFCKTTQKEKSEAIKEGKSEKESLSADIKKFSKQRDDLDKKIAKLAEEIKKSEGRQEKATTASDAAHKEYKTNEEDLKAALYALT